MLSNNAAGLKGQVFRRHTWRRGFVGTSRSSCQELAAWAEGHEDITLVEGAELGVISNLNEEASLGFFRDAPYRKELLSWMRLSKLHPGFGSDGLSYRALGVDGLEAAGAGVVLRDPVFSALDRFGMVASLISERDRTMSSCAVLIFHRPVDETPIETGRVLYRRLLELSGLGLQTWPMSVLADELIVAEGISQRYGVPAGAKWPLFGVWERCLRRLPFSERGCRRVS